MRYLLILLLLGFSLNLYATGEVTATAGGAADQSVNRDCEGAQADGLDRAPDVDSLQESPPETPVPANNPADANTEAPAS